MVSKQIFSRFSAIKGEYAPYKVQDAYTNLLVVTVIITVTLLGIGIYLFPMGGFIGVVLGFSAMIILRITQAAYTVIKYLIKGE